MHHFRWLSHGFRPRPSGRGGLDGLRGLAPRQPRCSPLLLSAPDALGCARLRYPATADCGGTEVPGHGTVGGNYGGETELRNRINET